MKKNGPLWVIVILSILDIIVGTYVITNCIIDEIRYETVEKNVTKENKIEVKREDVLKEEQNIPNDSSISQKQEVKKEEAEEQVEEKEIPLVEPVVYDGLTMNELSDKLNRSLGSTLSGYGYTFASSSLAYNMDPYLVVAIVLQETGCKWGCSTLVKECNNVGGIKGNPGCKGGSYKAFPTLEEGIKSYIENLYYNYYLYGLTTPETMNQKYAESTSWSYYVNQYINEIKAS